MNKILYILIPALLLPFLGIAQMSIEREVTANAGDYSTSPAMELSWTVGDLIVTTQQAGNLIVNQGFQQADNDMVGMPEPVFSGDITVFPNPVTDDLYFRISTDQSLRLRGELFDLMGKRVREIPPFEVNQLYEGRIDFRGLPAGKWMLRFTDDRNGLTETYTITKLR